MDSVHKLKSEEYEAHLFGFTSSDVTDGIKHVMTDQIKGSIDAMKRTILRQDGSKECENEINEVTDQLLNGYMSAFSRAMKDLEVEVKDIFHIPLHVLLPCDQAQKTQYTDEDEKRVDRELEQLRNRAKRAMCMETLMKMELNVLSSNIDAIETKVAEMKVALAEAEKERGVCVDSENVVKTVIELKERVKDL